VVEKCDRLHGFLSVYSLGGGTGSGLGTATLKLLRDNYPHVERYLSQHLITLINLINTNKLSVINSDYLQSFD